jgi:hypothetical protein
MLNKLKQYLFRTRPTGQRHALRTVKASSSRKGSTCGTGYDAPTTGENVARSRKLEQQM